MLSPIYSRLYFSIILVLIFFCADAQKVEARNDSFFINSAYINQLTKKETLDSLLGSKGKVKEQPGKTVKGSKKQYNVFKYLYKKLGLVFSKSDTLNSQLMIGIKLKRNSNEEIDNNHLPTDVFKGELYIGDNYMNDKLTIEQLRALKDCRLDYKQTSLTLQQSPSAITQAKLIYSTKAYNLLFDSKTVQLSCIFIY